MAINYPQFPKLNAADLGGLGGFDLGEAIRSGLGNYNLYQEAKFKPRNLENEAHGKELMNKIKEAQAKYAEEQALADLRGRQTSTSNIAQQIKERRNAMKRQQDLQNLLSGGSDMGQASGKPGHMTPHGFEGSLTGIPAEDLYSNTGEDRQAEQEAVDRIDRANDQNNEGSFIQSAPNLKQRINKGMQGNTNEKVLVPGNPNLSRINDIYNKYPQYRKELEAMGYKKSQSIKFDSKSGMNIITTTLPNGEVKVRTEAITGQNGTVPLTNALKSQLQNIKVNVPKVKRLVDDLIASPSPTEFPLYRKGARTKHHALVKEAAETYAKAKGWPNTNESIKAASEILGRGSLETDSDYRLRLEELKKELDRNAVEADETLNPNSKKSESNSHVVEYIRGSNGRLVPK